MRSLGAFIEACGGFSCLASRPSRRTTFEERAGPAMQPGIAASTNGSMKIEDLPQRKMSSLMRQELYDLFWASAIRILCKRFDVSNVWLAKICRRHRIPVPQRGYWAKHQAGGRPTPHALPPCGEESAKHIQIYGKDHVGKSGRNTEIETTRRCIQPSVE
jgi:hypothetical protein